MREAVPRPELCRTPAPTSQKCRGRSGRQGLLPHLPHFPGKRRCLPGCGSSTRRRLNAVQRMEWQLESPGAGPRHKSLCVNEVPALLYCPWSTPTTTLCSCRPGCTGTAAQDTGEPLTSAAKSRRREETMSSVGTPGRKPHWSLGAPPPTSPRRRTQSRKLQDRARRRGLGSSPAATQVGDSQLQDGEQS